jgi:hypothetical protein
MKKNNVILWGICFFSQLVRGGDTAEPLKLDRYQLYTQLRAHVEPYFEQHYKELSSPSGSIAGEIAFYKCIEKAISTFPPFVLTDWGGKNLSELITIDYKPSGSSHPKVEWDGEVGKNVWEMLKEALKHKIYKIDPAKGVEWWSRPWQR